MRTIKNLLLLLIVITFTNCDVDFLGFVSPPSKGIEKRFEESMELNKSNLSDTLLIVPTSAYSIYIGTDFHIIDKADNLKKFLSEANSDNSTAFTAILGDITDQKYGLKIAFDTITGS